MGKPSKPGFFLEPAEAASECVPNCPEQALAFRVDGDAVSASANAERARVPRRAQARRRRGTRSTGCPTAARSRRRSGRRGPSAAARRRATSRSGMAEAWLRDVARPGARAARCPAWSARARRSPTPRAEYLRYIEHDRDRKPSTLRDYRSMIRRAPRCRPSARMRLEDVTPSMVEAWQRRAAGRSRRDADQDACVVLHGIFERARKRLRAAGQPGRRRREAAAARSGDIEVFSPEEVLALVRAADVRAGRRDLPRPPRSPACGAASSSRCAGATSTSPAARSASARSYAGGQLTTPKSGKVRSVPMAPDVAEALARLGQREHCDRRRRPRLPRHRRRLPRRARRCAAATRPRCSAPGCGRCASTTCATRSARA